MLIPRLLLPVPGLGFCFAASVLDIGFSFAALVLDIGFSTLALVFESRA
jgi:hypothetical protein